MAETTVRDSWDAAFFDIGGVIVSLPSIRRGYADYVRSFAADRGMDPEEALETWRGALGDHFRSAEDTEYVTARAGYRRAFRELDPEVGVEEWEPAFMAATKRALEPEPGAVETIERLSGAGFYVGVVSDIDTWEADRIVEKFGLAGAVDGVTTSEDVGYKKPDPRMFADALGKARVPPGRALMVGDRYRHDMQGATRAGVQTVAYGGTAGEEIADAERAGNRVLGDPAVDYAVTDLRDVSGIVGLED